MTYSQETRVSCSPRHITVQVVGKFRVVNHAVSLQTGIYGHHQTLQVKMGKEGVLVTLAELTKDGWLTLYPGFNYDGASGAVDTRNVMRSAGFHDALCAMIALNKLPRTLIPVISKLYADVCLDDGMTGFRGWLHLNATRRASPEPGEYLKVSVYP